MLRTMAKLRIPSRRVLSFITVGLLICAHAQAQQPEPSPTRTGRAYSAPNLPKAPPPPGLQAPSPVTFSDIATQTGIVFKHAASKTSLKYLLETMGSGVAFFDYDNDERLDLFFTNGAALKDPMPREDRKST